MPKFLHKVTPELKMHTLSNGPHLVSPKQTNKPLQGMALTERPLCACLIACLIACLPACLPSCLLAFVCLPACLLACSTYLIIQCLDKTRHIFSQESNYGYLNLIIIIIMVTANLESPRTLQNVESYIISLICRHPVYFTELDIVGTGDCGPWTWAEQYLLFKNRFLLFLFAWQIGQLHYQIHCMKYLQ